MKKTFLSIVMLMFAFSIFAKEVKTVCFSVKMNCGSCEKKVKDELVFTKGVKFVEADYVTDIVKVEFDSDKTDKEALVKCLKKIGYKAQEIFCN